MMSNLKARIQRGEPKFRGDPLDKVNGISGLAATATLVGALSMLRRVWSGLQVRFRRAFAVCPELAGWVIQDLYPGCSSGAIWRLRCSTIPRPGPLPDAPLAIDLRSACNSPASVCGLVNPTRTGSLFFAGIQELDPASTTPLVL